MATLNDLPLAVRAFMRFYRYRTIDWGPGATLRRPLAEARVAVVTTAGLYRPDQPPFDASDKSGDPSWREIPADVSLPDLRIGHKSGSFDHAGLEQDRNLALPLDRLRELQADGIIGSVHHRHFSFMGSILRTGRLVDRTAPEVARLLHRDEVDAVLLTPV